MLIAFASLRSFIFSNEVLLNADKVLNSMHIMDSEIDKVDLEIKMNKFF